MREEPERPEATRGVPKHPASTRGKPECPAPTRGMPECPLPSKEMWDWLMTPGVKTELSSSSSCTAGNSGAGAQEKGTAGYREGVRGEEITSTRSSCTAGVRSAAAAADCPTLRAAGPLSALQLPALPDYFWYDFRKPCALPACFDMALPCGRDA
ncbi:UNVERIFIED_CONTAM: hypothetical protein FKN15_071664 [Acipenser sinensis]